MFGHIHSYLVYCQPVVVTVPETGHPYTKDMSELLSNFLDPVELHRLKWYKMIV